MKAPAKINLTLEVLARREDGYHGIRSVMVPLALSDELTADPAEAFRFECDRADLAGERNLAVVALRGATGGAFPAMLVRLFKRIPIQAGLGGGSSDAAAVLRMAMAGEFGALAQRDWMKLARSIGSDVPFFLAGTAALVEGTGERVTPAGAIPAWHVLIVKPPADVSTSDAYREIDRLERKQRPRSDSVSIAMLTALQRADFDAVERLLQNDFQEVIAARAPEVSTAVSALREAGAGNALLAGSGSCAFSLVRERSQAEAIASRLALPDTFARFVTRFAEAPDWQSPGFVLRQGQDDTTTVSW